MNKGQITSAPVAIVVLLIALVVITAFYSIEQRTGDYVKEQSVGVQADRLANAALILDSVRQGYIEIEMESYKLAVEKDFNITVGYKDTNASRILDTSTVSYDSIEKVEFQPVDYVCLQKNPVNGPDLVIEPGRC